MHWLDYRKIRLFIIASVAPEGKERRKTMVEPGRKVTVSEAPKSKMAEAGEIPSR